MNRTSYLNCRLFTGDGVIENAVIVVEHRQQTFHMPKQGELPQKVKASIDDCILYAGPVDQIPLDYLKTDEQIDVQGKTVLPGLIDADTRLDSLNPAEDDYVDNIGTAFRTYLSLRNCGEALNAGVTCLKAVGMPNNIDLALKEAMANTMFFGPAVFITGPVFGIHGSIAGKKYGLIECSGIEPFRTEVRIHLARGLDGITFQVSGDRMASIGGEFYPEMSLSELSAMVKHVQGTGKKVAVNASGDPSIRMALDAGVDIIQQGYRISNSMLLEMARQGVWYVPCLVSTLHTDLEEMHQDTVRNAIKAGVPIAVGTEILPSEPIDGTTAVIREMELLSKCGFNNTEVLMAATLNAASCIGCGSGKIGADGPADFIIVNGKPDLDLTDLRKIETVVHLGRRVFDMSDGKMSYYFSMDGFSQRMEGGSAVNWTKEAVRRIREPFNYNNEWNMRKEY